ncbi:hypothetical protein MHM88_14545 [Epibacterium sp. MM17-32]|uniref:hypothetical protein n=1 Tax=Epibacterium sp. MM17-32 TaxID=2917734 RepID=UPI001EF68917|nr:hypothetical protein [Epibacterium sp. MM17-32]MCG7629027.1 hypothetical protein [Epibacterium sp. MM17-32]
MQNWNIGDDILDTRDLEERIDELEALENDYLDAKAEHEEAVEEDYGATQEEIDQLHADLLTAAANFDADDRQELKQLRDFKASMEDYCDWILGETLIEEDYRETYAEQLASDIGAINRDARWPLRHIDWEAASEELFAHDYHHAELGGFTYYARMC